MLQDCQTTLSLVRRDIDLLTQKELPALIKGSCTQQVIKVLRGNYDLKIARQDYFIGNQDQVRYPNLLHILILRNWKNWTVVNEISPAVFPLTQLIKQLVSQRARNEFLTMAYEIESKGHRDTHRLLTSAAMLLQDNLNSYQDRLVCTVRYFMKERYLTQSTFSQKAAGSISKYFPFPSI